VLVRGTSTGSRYTTHEEFGTYRDIERRYASVRSINAKEISPTL